MNIYYDFKQGGSDARSIRGCLITPRRSIKNLQK